MIVGILRKLSHSRLINAKNVALMGGIYTLVSVCGNLIKLLLVRSVVDEGEVSTQTSEDFLCTHTQQLSATFHVCQIHLIASLLNRSRVVMER